MKAFYSFLLLVFLFSENSFAQWDGNISTVNNPVATSTFSTPDFSISDQYGGVIIAWQSSNQIYLQRKTVGGQLNWENATSPVTLFNGSGGSVELRDVISDKQSGVYVSYIHRINDSTSNLYLQQISSGGVKVFANAGILINPIGNIYSGEGKMALANDGVFIVWSSEALMPYDPVPLKSKLYLQKINKEGDFMLGASGIPVTNAASFQFWPILCPDENGGIYIAFTDTRNSNFANGIYNNYDVYAQRFDAAGNKLWQATDIVISDAPFHQTTHADYTPPAIRNERTILTSSDGAVYIMYGSADDEYYTDNYFLEVKKISPAAAMLWPNAVRAADNKRAHHFLQVDDDNEAGLVICWRHTGGMAIINGQRIAANGVRLWGNNGTQITPDHDQDFNMTGHSMTKSGDGNFVFTWTVDSMKSDMSDATTFVKAQKLNSSGDKLWGTNAVFICKNDDSQPRYPIVSKSLDSTTIITWKESRGIYAALVQSDGTLKNIENISGFTSISSGNWNDPSIWLNGLIPPPGADVIITQNITVNINIICNSITVQSPAVVTIAPGANLTVLN